jgi:hypothetical protein
MWRRGVAALAVLVLTVGARSQARAGEGSTVLLAAGDIASCSWTADESTGALLESNPGQVAVLGDNAYQNGTPDEYTQCYEVGWGRAKSRTRPTAGNHDYHTAGAAGYFGYFGTAAGNSSKGYYSYNLGSWHVVVLNSNCSAVRGCGLGSPQERWLQADLLASTASCTLAYWHHPRFSSGGGHGSDPEVGQFWQDLYARGAELVLSAHDHDYERFAPQNPFGQADSAYGLREFVVGTGGAPLGAFDPVIPNSEARDATTHGVLKLTLESSDYSWQFVPADGTFTDSGTGLCHGAPAPPPPPPPPPPRPPPPPPPPPPPQSQTPPLPLVRCVVPRVVGLRLARAEVLIRRARCSVGRIRRQRSKRAGSVLAQSPQRGVTRRAGTRIDLVVGR